MALFLNLPEAVPLLLALSVAAGFDLFLTLLVLGIFQELGWPGLQEPGPDPLHWGMMTGLFGLYILEAASELRPVPAHLWHTCQLLTRPLAGGLLALALLDGVPLRFRLLGALAGGGVCAFTHVLGWGRKLLLRLRAGGTSPLLVQILFEDALVLGYVLLAIWYPEAGAILATLTLLVGLLLGGHLHQVVRFGFLLLGDRTRVSMGGHSWRPEPEIPTWARLRRDTTTAPTLRGMRGGIDRVPGARGFRKGWVVEEGALLSFVFKKRGSVGMVPLEGFSFGKGEAVGLARRVPLETGGGAPAALFLQEGVAGPKAHKYQKSLDLGKTHS